MNKNGMYKNYEAHLFLDLTSVMTSEYAKEACEDKSSVGFGKRDMVQVEREVSA